VATPVPEFGTWATDVWLASCNKYGFVARRDADMLNQFYPRDVPRLTRLRVQEHGVDIGWICTTHADGRSRAVAHGFGDLKVGLLADAMGSPDKAATILAAGIRYLIAQGVDLIVTNQIHRAWRAPLSSLGFLSRPTNFLFAYSRQMRTLLSSELEAGEVFLNRGDCDGPPRWW
jgi:hypothetical protein